MTDDRSVVRAVSWRDLCPWLIIFRSFRVSISVSVLLLATIAVALTPLGWMAGGWLLEVDDAKRQTWAHEVMLTSPIEGVSTVTSPKDFIKHAWSDRGIVENVYDLYARPYVLMFNTKLTLRRFAYYLIGNIWTLLVWGLFAGAITRIAAMQLGREERVGLSESIGFTLKRFGSFFAAPIFPLLGALVIALPIALAGLLMNFQIGVIISGIFWFLVLLAGFIIGILLLGLLFGWPLMWATISSEGTDAFDALSRSYAYTFQRPLHYLFYALVTVLFGVVTWTLVFYFSTAVIELSWWGASWGTNVADRFTGHPDSGWAEYIKSARFSNSPPVRILEDGTEQKMSTLWFGAYYFIGSFEALVLTVAHAFGFAFFWCASVAIYLLLRRDVDQTEMDEVFVEDEEEQAPLPTIRPDSAGAPQVTDIAVPPKPAADDSGEASGSGETDEPNDGDGKSPDREEE